MQVPSLSSSAAVPLVHVSCSISVFYKIGDAFDKRPHRNVDIPDDVYREAMENQEY